jgi:beta-aspartyl-peptidase (threonine type)
MIALSCCDRPGEINVTVAIAIHGGAGTLPRAEMTAERESAYRGALKLALDAGFGELERGSSALDAVTIAVEILEDQPLFNAGRGAVLTWDGRAELDASIMEGATLAAGAVAGLSTVKRPIRLARLVMEKSDHVFLVGAGAEQFAAQQGVEFVPNEYFHTAPRRSQLEHIRAGDKALSPLTISHLGTVGAVARDSAGNVAAGTSTGGMTGKRFNRVGDSPIIGAGTYADNRACAVSATGHGELFIRAAVAHDICARMRYGGRSLAEAVNEVVYGELVALRGEGGVIAVDAAGRIAMEFNCEGMFRGCKSSQHAEYIAIYK